MTEMQEDAPRGAFLPPSLMYLYSGAPMHLCSGVDIDTASTRSGQSDLRADSASGVGRTDSARSIRTARRRVASFDGAQPADARLRTRARGRWVIRSFEAEQRRLHAPRSRAGSATGGADTRSADCFSSTARGRRCRPGASERREGPGHDADQCVSTKREASSEVKRPVASVPMSFWNLRMASRVAGPKVLVHLSLVVAQAPQSFLHPPSVCFRHAGLGGHRGGGRCCRRGYGWRHGWRRGMARLGRLHGRGCGRSRRR